MFYLYVPLLLFFVADLICVHVYLMIIRTDTLYYIIPVLTFNCICVLH